MKGLDTNVLVRYLVQDDPKQAAQASKFIEANCTDETPCFVGQIVLCELAWVLESNYSQDREQITSIIEQLLQVGQLEVMEPEVVWRALHDYKNSNADFPDHLLARVNESQGCDVTMTFDRKAAKQLAFQMLK
ncbi:MAG: type II toxin-antitoxin system VapC family toxin [Candidatus Thiodiazotropha sp. (ex Lucinoma kastoroae)]|nr:type II toxin-antitoxin system VapC family toxin [Candidatus Thiodiazotropha sp. (ex Rostrolucina anterorostrata)]MCU7849356.1 type II toxin-antitoxin system VapC family toxin [Candidatus Thiodiazotropha sp. (ex Lucinoma kastoroae)]MCU7861103.1 type II toxin-antitoxin system VapC family toxin [Candidatus Thiodiazotropha sp. (ex Lucinoma kastoroae)]